MRRKRQHGLGIAVRAFLLYGLRRLNHRLDRRRRLGDLLHGDVEVGDGAHETLAHRTDAHAAIGEALGDLVGGEAGAADVEEDDIIPTCIDQNPCAHSRMPMEVIFHGRSMSLFRASQQSATMSS